MTTARQHVCLGEGSFVVNSGLITEALLMGSVWHLCSSPDSPTASSLSAFLPEYGRLGSWHAKVSLALLRAALSPLGEFMREGHALSPSGGPADSQGCRSVGPLCARTGKSCLDHLPLFSISVLHVFLSSPPHSKVPLSELSIPSPLLPFLRGALEVPQAISNPSFPRPPQCSLLSLSCLSKLQPPCTPCYSPMSGSLNLCLPLTSSPVSLEALPATAEGLSSHALPPSLVSRRWPPLGRLPVLPDSSHSGPFLDPMADPLAFGQPQSLAHRRSEPLTEQVS